MTARFVGLLLVAIAAQLPGANASAPVELSLESSRLEEQLLADAADGRWDEHSLFAAAAIAGGAETERELDNLERKFATLSVAVRTDLPPAQSPVDRGRGVIEFLHQRVFSGGYDLQATEPATVFATGRYNCVSATLFFNCLAREAGLHAHAVKLPQHTRSAIVDGELQIAIETTTEAWSSDSSRYDADSSTHAISDVALVAMVYYNRGVEALRRRRFEEAIRLNRLALALDPDNTDARGNLLAAINRRALELAAGHQFAPALELFDAGLAIAPDHAPLRKNRALVVQSQQAQDATGEAAFN
jgi:tetratricopeptide (TPR) repeat protein